MPVTEYDDIFSWKSLELWEINAFFFFFLSHPVHATLWQKPELGQQE